MLGTIILGTKIRVLAPILGRRQFRPPTEVGCRKNESLKRVFSKRPCGGSPLFSGARSRIHVHLRHNKFKLYDRSNCDST